VRGSIAVNYILKSDGKVKMRYIGSKVLLLEQIEEIINDKAKDSKSLCDIFSGTSTVARYFKKDFEIISNDLLYLSFILQKAIIENEKYPNFTKIINHLGKDPFDYLNDLEINLSMLKSTPFIYENYSPNFKSKRQYFSNENALRIDYFRQTIEEWKNKHLLEENEYYYLLAGLIEATPFVSNIAGTYGAYLKHWDNRSLKKLELIKLETISNNKNNKSYNRDANELIKEIKGDIIYIDPPYNKRQYAPNYHVLETISRYDNPIISGITGMRPYKELKSKYCIAKDVLNSFADLIKNANFKHIIFSYSTEGIMSIEQIEAVLKEYGIENTYQLTKIPYRRYKRRAGNVEHDLHELLFYIEKDVKC
jgi:adenine-specific DNA-methyltransferase